MLVVPTLGGGGAERVILRVARHMHERGNRVTIVVFRGGGAYEPLVPEGIRLITLGGRAPVVALSRTIRRERPEVILSTLVEANLACVFARRLARSRARLVIRETIHISTHGKRQGGWVWRVLPRLIALLYPRANAVIANAQAMADDLVELGVPANKIHVVGNPVVEPSLVAAGREPAVQAWAHHKPLVLGVGRLVHQKGFDVLLHALARMDPETHLALLGEGPDRDALLQLAADLGLEHRIHMPGFINPPWPVMARADVVALSSRTEGMPNVLIQALALGTPVVATDCPSGPRELLGQHLPDALVPVDDAEALAKAIQRSLAQPPSAEAMAAAVRPFDAATCLAQYEAILEGRI